MSTILEHSHREYRTFVKDAIGVQVDLPVIITEHGVLDQFARYMYLYKHMSRSWQDSATFAVQLLLEYMEANQRFHDTARSLFIAFSDSLYSGTIMDRIDPSGLYWDARSSDDASKLIGHVTRFSDWLAEVNENVDLQLNPWREASRHEQRLNWAAYSHKRDNAFLSHLWRSKPQTDQSRVIRSRSLPMERLTPAKAFPEQYFEPLIYDGFRRRARDSRGPTDLRNVLITYLMHYGSLRLSEALSLWNDDVSFEDGELIVRVYHPEKGLAPDGRTRRDNWLERRYGLKPRKQLVKSTDRLHLGWKNPLITDHHRKCFEVFFYLPNKEQEFLGMWLDYHQKQRVKPKAGEDHPYAFTNRDGRPYSHRMFRDAHELAIERIGLDYHKMAGTTPHGHRHAYGQRLAQGGASQLLIKNAMHHQDIKSCLVYTQPTAIQMRQELRDMEARMLLRLKNNSNCQLTKV
ncbi:MAG: site-specific integrase [Pseudomonadaceae bacterium]|nr:site-specific integrase [Pseudomonadaceae bacterium]